MRLLNTLNLGLENHTGRPPPYAILSHVWTSGEVLFDDIQDLRLAKQKPRFDKIKMACQAALKMGLHHIWIDTCCIDRSSSAELNEAINSMFHWYHTSAVCIAYLEDLPASKPRPVALWSDCRWFKRGWTLQELIAPDQVSFYDQKWNCVGDKKTLAQAISQITGIPANILIDRHRLRETSVAVKMSWAAGRTTTRIEDTAYSLMGIFDVHMPLLYGEREKAFQRLQEEIIMTTPDSSIFAWCEDGGANTYRGIFARSPREFEHFGTSNLVSRSFSFSGKIDSTNQGLRIPARLLRRQNGDVLMSLTDGVGSTDSICVLLRELPDTPGVYVRIQPRRIITLQGWCRYFGSKEILVRRETNRLGPFQSSVANLSIQTTDRGREAAQTTPGTLGGIGPVKETVPWYINRSLREIENLTVNGFGEASFNRSLNRVQNAAHDSFFFEGVAGTMNTISGPLTDGNSPMEGEIPLQSSEDSSESNSSGQFHHAIVLEEDHPFLRYRRPLYEKALMAFDQFVSTDEHESHGIRSWAQSHSRSDPLLACPYYKFNSSKYRSCLKTSKLISIDSVAKHLLSQHRRPNFCPTCYATFKLMSDRDKHIMERMCQGKVHVEVEGVSMAQEKSLGNKALKYVPAQERWFIMWRILFPNRSSPSSVFVDPEITSAKYAVEAFWKIRGLQLVAEFLGTKGELDSSGPDKDQALEGLASLVLSDMVDSEVLGRSSANFKRQKNQEFQDV
ncbi:heterokaryon incompatibility protein-domain-containing protein [Xylariomycetidae sp. FL0641]|nr:heterokaryon incompatibility protein-domain-containing protein [Xylariomycetidae sp. FL0641]